ncbi:Resolvase domain protein [Ammonifex degensii KC4]|uniref:Resolvase domain protein n=1 Tax=Ammonifex degensii (strain DSM 10501 / KC4) TaxID=429009 RepID=C9RAX8_AMMDK|nr:IS607 family transposase [Ammonifex degensii]ACX51405.1 Resolvase domain protein [Ammonifex degensii KC4]
MKRKLLTLKECREIYGLSRGSLLNYEKQGLITPARTPGGVRRYKVEDIERLLGLLGESSIRLKTVLYARVSTRKQEAYLKNQVKRLEEFARERGWDYEVIQEIASGVNENRRGLQKLLNMVKRGEVERVVVECPDRLARFGFEYLRNFFDAFGVELVVLNGGENEEQARELAEDLVAIVTSFAAKIYGKRGGKKK